MNRSVIRQHHQVAVRVSWPILVFLGCLLSMVLSVSAFADTYNFFFKKPGEEFVQETEAPQPASSVPAPAPVPQVPTPPTAVPVNPGNPNAQTQTFTAPPGQPIVIHNINNVGAAGQGNTAPITAPAQVTPSTAVPQMNIETAQRYRDSDSEQADFRRLDLRARVHEPSSWKLGVMGAMTFQEFDYSYISQGQESKYRDFEPTWGGLLSLNYSVSRRCNLNFYGGGHYLPPSGKVKFNVGGDLELLPFKIPLKRGVDLFELGFLVGASNMMASERNGVSIHAGARFNINFGESFGITTGVRGNLGYAMFEAGIITRL